MSSNRAIVEEFIRAWSRLDASELADYFAEDGVYHNIPAVPVVGRENIRQFIAGFIKPWTHTNWVISNILADGDLVMVERLDKTRTSAGDVDLPCVGVFVLKEGKIVVWRDYFDMGTYRSALTKTQESSG